jgi:DNA-binding transcriptional MerR regulator
MEKEIYTRKEVAKMLDISVCTLRNWERKKNIEPPIRIGRRVYFTIMQLNTLLKY